MARQTYRRFSGSLISWVYGEISWVISFFRKFYLPSWNKKLEVVNCDFKLGGDRYLPMAFPEFVIILDEVPPTFNTRWDATGWPKSLQRSFYEKGVFGGIQKISRVCVHLFHRSPFNKLYDYNYPKYIFSRPHLLYLMSFQIKHEMSFMIYTRPRHDSTLIFRTNWCFDYCTGK